MKFKTIAFAGVAGAALLAGSVVAPANAAAKTTISIHVQNASKKALKDVYVQASKGDTFVYVGRTNSKGNITKSQGSDGTLSGGKWTFFIGDGSDARYKSKKLYASTTFKATLSSGKNTTIKTKTLATGSHILGTVTAPSGRPISGAQVLASTSSTYRDVVSGDVTGAKGTFHVFGLPKGTLYLLPFAGGNEPKPTKVKITKAGSSAKGVKIKNLRVLCETGFTAASNAPGTVDVSIKSTAAGFGLKNPGGTVVVSVDGTPIDTIAWKNLSALNKTYTGQAAGQHTYSVKYTGGDCVNWNKNQTGVAVESDLS